MLLMMRKYSILFISSQGHFSSAMNEISERRVVQELIYNNLLTAIITIITKLNLSVQTVLYRFLLM